MMSVTQRYPAGLHAKYFYRSAVARGSIQAGNITVRFQNIISRSLAKQVYFFILFLSSGKKEEIMTLTVFTHIVLQVQNRIRCDLNSHYHQHDKEHFVLQVYAHNSPERCLEKPV